MTDWTIRPGRDSDVDGIVALIGTCWGEYPGCILDVDGELPELRALATYYAEHNGALWVAEADGSVVGMIATQPLDGGTWEICKVYALPSFHGSGLGHGLLDAAEAHAMAARTCVDHDRIGIVDDRTNHVGEHGNGRGSGDLIRVAHRVTCLEPR